MVIISLYKHILYPFNISIEQYFILECIYLKMFDLIDKKKYLLEIQNLYRRKFIDSYSEQEFPLIQEYFLTFKSTEILKTTNLVIKELNPVKIHEFSEELFNEFWELFPTSDKFLNFPKTRILRINKDECKRKYLKILKEGNVTHDDIIKALTYEIEFNKSSSSFKENKFKYMKASTTWLNQAYYETLLEDLKSNNKIIENNDWTSESI